MPHETAVLIGREIAAAMNENREEAVAALQQHLKGVGETASLDSLTVRNLNADQVLIEGAGVTEQAASFLRGAGFEVIQAGNAMVAKKDNKNRKPANPQRGGYGANKGNELLFFNDDKSIRDARKMFQTLVEAQDWRYFPQFLKDLDNVVVNARMREGHDADSDPSDGSTAENTEQRHAPLLKNDDKGKAVASATEAVASPAEVSEPAADSKQASAA